MEEEAPGPIVKNTREVLREIVKYEANGLGEFAEKYDSFYNKYCYLEDGGASKRTVRKIFFGEA